MGCARRDPGRRRHSFARRVACKGNPTSTGSGPAASGSKAASGSASTSALAGLDGRSATAPKGPPVKGGTLNWYLPATRHAGPDAKRFDPYPSLPQAPFTAGSSATRPASTSSSRSTSVRSRSRHVRRVAGCRHLDGRSCGRTPSSRTSRRSMATPSRPRTSSRVSSRRTAPHRSQCRQFELHRPEPDPDAGQADGRLQAQLSLFAVFPLGAGFALLLDLPAEAINGGFDPAKKMIGSGPWMLDSFTPDVAESLQEEPRLLRSRPALRRLGRVGDPSRSECAHRPVHRRPRRLSDGSSGEQRSDGAAGKSQGRRDRPDQQRQWDHVLQPGATRTRPSWIFVCGRRWT